MIERNVEIINKLGLHARPAAIFVQKASKFKSEITLEKEGQKVNGKSIMGVMMLAAEKGSTLIIRAEGEDENEAVAALVEVVLSKFGEE
ncbi:MAG TPA: HPr family phosphocarrier protein [candidate division Zixibacteria bacterium]